MGFGDLTDLISLIDSVAWIDLTGLIAVFASAYLVDRVDWPNRFGRFDCTDRINRLDSLR